MVEQIFDVAAIELLPWRSFDSNDQEEIAAKQQAGWPNARLVVLLEDRFPRFFVKHFQYPMIVLKR